MAKVYIVRHTPIRGDDQFRAFDSFEKAKTYIESIPNIVERYPEFWECFFYGEQFENWRNMGIYTIYNCEVE